MADDGTVMYANSWRLPPHTTQAKTSNANVLRSSLAQATGGIGSFAGSPSPLPKPACSPLVAPALPLLSCMA